MPYKDKADPRCKKAKLRWYYRNKFKHLAITREITHQKMEYLRKLKSSPCADCGGEFPYYVMDFDHRDRSMKKFTIGLMLHEGWGRIREEVAKCDIVCANCHRIRTYKDRAPSSSG